MSNDDHSFRVKRIGAHQVRVTGGWEHPAMRALTSRWVLVLAAVVVVAALVVFGVSLATD